MMHGPINIRSTVSFCKLSNSFFIALQVFEFVLQHITVSEQRKASLYKAEDPPPHPTLPHQVLPAAATVVEHLERKFSVKRTRISWVGVLSRTPKGIPVLRSMAPVGQYVLYQCSIGTCCLRLQEDPAHVHCPGKVFATV